MSGPTVVVLQRKHQAVYLAAWRRDDLFIRPRLVLIRPRGLLYATAQDLAATGGERTPGGDEKGTEYVNDTFHSRVPG